MPVHPPPPRRPQNVRKGGFTLTELSEYLRLSRGRIRSELEELGIELRPYVRDDGVVRKVYKQFYEPLTAKEAAKVIARVRRKQGRAALKRAEGSW